jgi:hypothetical protein
MIAGLLLWQMNGDWKDLLGFLLFVGGVTASNHFYLRFPFRVIRHRGNEFWLKGASPEFLEALRPDAD